MNVLVIPDKFKGSLTAGEVIRSIEIGLRQFDSQIEIHSITASDGGDGFLDAITQCQSTVQPVHCETLDPLGRTIDAVYGYDPVRRAAYIEMARASGMELLHPSERNPQRTSTAGTGRLIVDAVRRGASQLYIGLGGSATNDGGIGIADAVGYRFLDSNRNRLEPSGAALMQVESIDAENLLLDLEQIRVHAINDVANPLIGPEGAAAVYAPQKGADPSMVKELDQGLDRLQQIVRRDLGRDACDLPGAGAAGGTGYGLKVFLNADFLSGIEFVLALTGIEPQLAGGTVDWIVTGEGRIDDQTAYGKLVRGVSRIGARYGVPVAALCGQLSLKERSIKDLGLARAIEIHEPNVSLEYTIGHAQELLIRAAARLFAVDGGNERSTRD